MQKDIQGLQNSYAVRVDDKKMVIFSKEVFVIQGETNTHKNDSCKKCNNPCCFRSGLRNDANPLKPVHPGNGIL